MTWEKRTCIWLAGIVAGLFAAGPVYADIVALVAAYSAPPKQAFLIDPAKGTIGGLKLHAPAVSYVKKLGFPDYIGALETTTSIEMLWSHTTSPKTGWATATLHSASSTKIDQLRFAGLFRTDRGDHRGTSLKVFLNHWRLEGPVVTGVVNNGNLVEYNVVVGGVVFAFDENKTLAAVGLASAGVERTLCVIPSACVVSRIK